MAVHWHGRTRLFAEIVSFGRREGGGAGHEESAAAQNVGVDGLLDAGEPLVPLRLTPVKCAKSYMGDGALGYTANITSCKAKMLEKKKILQS